MYIVSYIQPPTNPPSARSVTKIVINESYLSKDPYYIIIIILSKCPVETLFLSKYMRFIKKYELTYSTWQFRSNSELNARANYVPQSNDIQTLEQLIINENNKELSVIVL